MTFIREIGTEVPTLEEMNKMMEDGSWGFQKHHFNNEEEYLHYLDSFDMRDLASYFDTDYWYGDVRFEKE